MQPRTNHSDSTEPRQAPRGYIPALDGLRGLAVLAVIAFHLASYAQPDGAVAEAVIKVLRFGWVGVDLFFVLSGFLITGILYDNRNGRSRMRGFYGRRLLRIAPLYYVTLAVIAVIVSISAAPEQVAALYKSLPWHSAFLTNIRIAIVDSWSAAPMKTGHLWSLAVEEQFYLVWPAVIAAAVAWAKSPRVMLIRICVVLIAASIFFRLWILPQHDLAAYTLLFARMDALAIGASIALWIRGPKGVTPALEASQPTLIVCGAAVVGLGVVTAGTYSYLHPLQQGAGYTLWAAMFGALLVRTVAIRTDRLAKALTIRPLIEIGKISYALYLLHFPVMYFLDWVGVTTLGILPFAVTTVVVSGLVSTLSWRYLESPLLRLKSYFPYDAEPGPVRSSSPQIVHER